MRRQIGLQLQSLQTLGQEHDLVDGEGVRAAVPALGCRPKGPGRRVAVAEAARVRGNGAVEGLGDGLVHRDFKQAQQV